jgi:hypothetical protein
MGEMFSFAGVGALEAFTQHPRWKFYAPVSRFNGSLGRSLYVFMKDEFDDVFSEGEEDSRTTQRRDVANLFIML